MASLAPDMQITPELRLVRFLGQGSMGDVWVADMNGREVAVKFITADLQKDPTSLERFKREWRVACTIESPHVVEMIGAGQTERGQHYIIMELLDGDDLEKVVEGMVGGMSPTATITLLEQIASALDAAHQKGIVHRDIKPENVYLCRQDGGLVVKILDFGLAKSISGNMNLTATGVLVGTPYYMSPEQLLDGGQNLDHRADLWAFGALAYRMLLGSQPFDADSLTDLIIAITDGRYAPVAQAGGPAALEPYFAKAFQVDREKRFGSASEMVRELARVLGVGDRAGEAATEVMGSSLDSTLILDEDQTPLFAPAMSTAEGYPQQQPHASSTPPVAVVPLTTTSAPPPRLVKVARQKNNGGVIAAVVAALVLAVVGVVGFWLVGKRVGEGSAAKPSAAPSATPSAAPEPPAAPTVAPVTAPKKPLEPMPSAKPEPSAEDARSDGEAPSEDGKTYLRVVCDCIVHIDERRQKSVSSKAKPVSYPVPAGKRVLTTVSNEGTKKDFVVVKEGTVRTVVRE